MSITVKLTETATSFLSKMGEALAPILNASLYRNRQKVIRQVRSFVERQIRLQPEVRELSSVSSPMSLNAMLGITSAQGIDAVNAIVSNIKPVSLGDSRLRTETAGIVACHLINILNA